MIARIWRGAVVRSDSDAYADYMQATGLAEYRATAVTAGRGCCAATSETGPRS